jgi:hypothetical protein
MLKKQSRLLHEYRGGPPSMKYQEFAWRAAGRAVAV